MGTPKILGRNASQTVGNPWIYVPCARGDGPRFPDCRGHHPLRWGGRAADHWWAAAMDCGGIFVCLRSTTTFPRGTSRQSSWLSPNHRRSPGSSTHSRQLYLSIMLQKILPMTARSIAAKCAGF